MNAGEADPWSGDDVPVAPGLGEIIWDTPSANDAADGIEAETVNVTAASPSRRLLIPAVAVAAVGVILLAVFAWPDPSESDTAENSSTSPATPTTLDTLPDATTTAPPTTVPPSTIREVEPIAAVTDELPDALADADLETEVVTVTADGELITVSIPAGDVTERVDLGLSRVSQFTATPGVLVLSPDAAMYATGNDLVVVPTGGDALPVDRDDFGGTSAVSQRFPFGWTTDIAGTNVFVVIAFDPTGRQSEWLVTAAGEVSPAPAQRSSSFARPIYSLGTRFVDDAGGTYRVDPSGDSIRVTSGQVLATSETRLLLRECNANRVCNAVLRDYDGTEVRVVNLPPTFQPRFFVASLSPDDTAVTFADTNFTGERTIIDLETGETQLFTEQAREVSPPTWSSESSGVFTFGSEGGIRFLDRATGDEFSFAGDLGQLRAIATRSAGE